MLRQGQVDLKMHVRDGAKTGLEDEIGCLFGRRNKIVHHGGEAQIEEAQQAIYVATELIDAILPKVFSSLDLAVSNGQLLDVSGC